MKALSLIPGTTDLHLVDIPVPDITADDEIKVKVLQVGVCGTDRDEVSGGRATAPQNKNELIIGHEMLGEVLETGAAVRGIKPGDIGVLMVRRGCGQCTPCLNGRSDMCVTGNYTERGIKGEDGFNAMVVVDKAGYFVKVPPELKEIAILTEPMSIVSKAISEAMLVQSARFSEFEPQAHSLRGKRTIVAGLGAVGLLAAFALRLRGAEVFGLDIVDGNTIRPGILKEIGGTYLDLRHNSLQDVDDSPGPAEFIFEAAGIAKVQLNLIDALAVNGVYVITGIPEGERPVSIPGARLMKQMVLKNQILLGSVNAGKDHYRQAVDDLQQIFEKWPAMIKTLVTSEYAYEDYRQALLHHSENDIKVVIRWNE